ncbi:carbon starvation CstA family protein [Halosegnis longus]|uniref:Carbon starvation protein A n=1 Tax=Halosegnis longus TaxID=2216012 RepID=A0AAJ4R6J6_9EURY|nr:MULTISPECIES: carbon starvation CstA family protein [Halobacteriales]RNJ25257.1 carbon starvation protein A [Salella cibi]
MVQIAVLVVASLITFSVGYLGYSRYLAQFVELDDEQETPAHKYEDGQEYVPSKKPVLLGHHYSSIAGGAPIVGPITAGAAFGWLPAILWIAIGNPLLGAAHDFMALSSSVRHDGKSIGSIIGEYVGDRGKDMLLWFAFLTIILVIAVFAFVVAIVFNAFPSAATASFIYLALAVVFGVYLYQLNLPFLPGAVAFVAMVFGGVWVGLQYPIALVGTESTAADTIVLLGQASAWDWLPLAGSGVNVAAWVPVVVLYGFIASVLPVWVLLQPRDFLTSSLLYTGVGGMLLGAILAPVLGFTAVDVSVLGNTQTITSLETSYPAFRGLTSSLGPIFPFLFVTIACGTISGFHALVSSGTTAKQLDKESDARDIGYGAMLGEGLLATTAVGAFAVIGFTDFSAGAAGALANFPAGGAAMLSMFGLPVAAGSAFIGLVFVSFLLTSTDTAVRLGRYMMEEIVEVPETRTQELAVNRYVTSGVLLCLPAYLLVGSGAWESLWPLFGAANQTLAALALLAATLWLANWNDSKQLLSTGLPMVLMIGVTMTALLTLGLYRNPLATLDAIQNLGATGENASTIFDVISYGLQSVLALVLAGLAGSLAYMGYKNINRVRDSYTGAPADD